MFSRLECQHGNFSIVSIQNWSNYREGFQTSSYRFRFNSCGVKTDKLTNNNNNNV